MTGWVCTSTGLFAYIGGGIAGCMGCMTGLTSGIPGGGRPCMPGFCWEGCGGIVGGIGEGYMGMPFGAGYGTSWAGYGERMRAADWGGAGPGIQTGCPYAGAPPLTTMGLGTGLGWEYMTVGLGAWLIIGE